MVVDCSQGTGGGHRVRRAVMGVSQPLWGGGRAGDASPFVPIHLPPAADLMMETTEQRHCGHFANLMLCWWVAAACHSGHPSSFAISLPGPDPHDRHF